MAPLVVAEEIEWVGAPGTWASSNISERGFCRDCGTPLFLRDFATGRTEVMAGTLDTPALAAPTYHYGVESQVSWVKLADGLPRNETADGGEGIVSRQASASPGEASPDTRVFPTYYRNRPPAEDPFDYIEEVSGFVTTLGQLLFSVDDMPEWAPEGHAMFMASRGFGNSVGSFIENVSETRLECELGLSQIEAARLLQRGFEAAGFKANARVAAWAVQHLSGDELSPAELKDPVGYVDNPSAIYEGMGRFLQEHLRYEIKRGDWIRANERAAVDAIPEEIYWPRATTERYGIGEEFRRVMQRMGARLYDQDWPRYSRGNAIPGIPEMKRGTSRLGGLLKSVEKVGDRAVVFIKRLETSQGDLHEVTYRDAMVLRDPDGNVLERVNTPEGFYKPGTPRSLFWSADKAPDWRLEKTDHGWVAAY